MITQLLYTSASRYPRGHPTDFQILAEALERNTQLGVTGYLLRDFASFCQVLEGPDASVDLLFSEIARDTRHDRVVVRMRRQVTERAFLGWSMGYASLSPNDAEFLATRFADGRGGVLLAFDRVGRIAATGS
ncbi:BLUF domain-containing protein [Salipiger thiooxidans]|uniref:BLUF domain-containing protein n=1 Tax=Salipiger thiooxidans TaxID=282683 RepID=UPI001CD2419B|nr:BLUF domain-containing protein [Salipiger thiooxidans]MCA0845712.1 BLUF domain-containing protein [Salipiger thiooxidans]